MVNKNEGYKIKANETKRKNNKNRGKIKDEKRNNKGKKERLIKEQKIVN